MKIITFILAIFGIVVLGWGLKILFFPKQIPHKPIFDEPIGILHIDEEESKAEESKAMECLDLYIKEIVPEYISEDFKNACWLESLQADCSCYTKKRYATTHTESFSEENIHTSKFDIK